MQLTVTQIISWNPNRYRTLSGQNKIGHGTFFWHAYEAGYIKPNSSIHAGIRTRFTVGGFDIHHLIVG
jgi:agmatinase